MVFGGQAFGRQVMRTEPSRWSKCPHKRDEREMTLLFHMGGYRKKAAFGKPGRGLSPDTELPATWSWISQPPELWEIHVCCFSIQPMVFCYSSSNWLRHSHHSLEHISSHSHDSLVKDITHVLSDCPAFQTGKISHKEDSGVRDTACLHGDWEWGKGVEFDIVCYTWFAEKHSLPHILQPRISCTPLLSLPFWLLSTHKYISLFLLSSLSVSLSL